MSVSNNGISISQIAVTLFRVPVTVHIIGKKSRSAISIKFVLYHHEARSLSVAEATAVRLGECLIVAESARRRGYLRCRPTPVTVTVYGQCSSSAVFINT